MRQLFLLRTTLLLAVMLSSFTSRAFTVTKKAFFAGSTRSTRLAMSTTDTETTSIVDQCRLKIQQALETESVKVTGAFDDPNGSHIAIEVVSSAFEGKRPVQRQQLVYKALWEELQGPVHAVDSMICKTPSEV